MNGKCIILIGDPNSEAEKVANMLPKLYPNEYRRESLFTTDPNCKNNPAYTLLDLDDFTDCNKAGIFMCYAMCDAFRYAVGKSLIEETATGDKIVVMVMPMNLALRAKKKINEAFGDTKFRGEQETCKILLPLVPNNEKSREWFPGTFFQCDAVIHNIDQHLKAVAQIREFIDSANAIAIAENVGEMTTIYHRDMLKDLAVASLAEEKKELWDAVGISFWDELRNTIICLAKKFERIYTGDDDYFSALQEFTEKALLSWLKD